MNRNSWLLVVLMGLLLTGGMVYAAGYQVIILGGGKNMEADAEPQIMCGGVPEDSMNKNGNKGNSDEELKNRLTDLQYMVTQEDGTEPPFNNEYWDTKEEGIYVDVVSGEPLFSSLDKFDSGTGWPSFTRPLYQENIREKVDHSYGMVRIEVRSTEADSHLGHLFNDGPGPDGLRYCINSASLRFVSKQNLQQEGYGEYLRLFEQEKD